MRRLCIGLLLLFAVAFSAGFLAPVEAASDLGCTYSCNCLGQVVRCCPKIGGGTHCAVWTGPSPIQCPQVVTC